MKPGQRMFFSPGRRIFYERETRTTKPTSKPDALSQWRTMEVQRNHVFWMENFKSKRDGVLPVESRRADRVPSPVPQKGPPQVIGGHPVPLRGVRLQRQRVNATAPPPPPLQKTPKKTKPKTKTKQKMKQTKPNNNKNKKQNTHTHTNKNNKQTNKKTQTSNNNKLILIPHQPYRAVPLWYWQSDNRTSTAVLPHLRATQKGYLARPHSRSPLVLR